MRAFSEIRFFSLAFNFFSLFLKKNRVGSLQYNNIYHFYITILYYNILQVFLPSSLRSNIQRYCSLILKPRKRKKRALLTNTRTGPNSKVNQDFIIVYFLFEKYDTSRLHVEGQNFQSLTTSRRKKQGLQGPDFLKQWATYLIIMDIPIEKTWGVGGDRHETMLDDMAYLRFLVFFFFGKRYRRVSYNRLLGAITSAQLLSLFSIVSHLQFLVQILILEVTCVSIEQD
ncbi:hypothetical protein ACJX0J_008393, partial [Zea mays]